jgi:hypothetical protein
MGEKKRSAQRKCMRRQAKVIAKAQKKAKVKNKILKICN